MNWGDPTIDWKEKILRGERKEIIEILEEIFPGIIEVKIPNNIWLSGKGHMCKIWHVFSKNN